MYGYIYKRTNTVNGMTYIGQHKFTECVVDKKYKGSGTYFRRALSKYGDDVFTYEIVDTANSILELDEKEIFWIKKLNTVFPNGYNICLGGHKFHISEDMQHLYAKMGNLARGTGWHQSEKQKSVVREYMKNREITDGFRKKCSIAKKGNTNGKGNLNSIWISDGKSQKRIKQDDVIPSGFHPGRLLTDDTLSKYKESYTNRVYVNKDGVEKYIPQEELHAYLENGYTQGRNPDSYHGRGSKISTSKHGKIRVKSESGKIKYISQDLVEEFKELGFYPTNRKKTT